MLTTEDVTGRDGYIIRKALAYAIEAIDALPYERREVSDQMDMKDLLSALVDSDVELSTILAGARRHLLGEPAE